MVLILATRPARRRVFLGFGIQLLVDAGPLSADAAKQEQREAEQAVGAADRQQVSPGPWRVMPWSRPWRWELGTGLGPGWMNVCSTASVAACFFSSASRPWGRPGLTFTLTSSA
jgi:hypothetical protein